jgi:hypothetical protein
MAVKSEIAPPPCHRSGWLIHFALLGAFALLNVESLGQENSKIYPDDFRANAVHAFLGLLKEGNLEEAFRRCAHDRPGQRFVFNDFVRFIEGDAALNKPTSVRIKAGSRARGDVGLVDAQTADSAGRKFDVHFELYQPPDDPEGESWAISAIISQSRFPKPVTKAPGPADSTRPQQTHSKDGEPNLRSIDLAKIAADDALKTMRKDWPGENFGFFSADPRYGDITGDGIEEAAVWVRYRLSGEASTSSYSHVYVYTPRGGRAVLLQTLEGGDRAYGGVESVHIENRLVILSRYRPETPTACNSCYGFIETTSYKWDGTKLTSGSVQVRKFESTKR